MKGNQIHSLRRVFYILLNGLESDQDEQVCFVGQILKHKSLGLILTDGEINLIFPNNISIDTKHYNHFVQIQCHRNQLSVNKLNRQISFTGGLEAIKEFKKDPVDPRRQLNYKKSQNWLLFIKRVKIYFNNLGLEEVTTPSLVMCPGTEPYLNPFVANYTNSNSCREKLFLPTSPEIHLKKMLADGWTDIYEVSKSFRNGERGEHHLSEFTLLEWYRAYADLELIQDDLLGLFSHLLDLYSQQNVEISTLTVAQAFQTYLSYELTPQTSREELCSLCQKLEIVYKDDDSWDDLYFRIFLDHIEPQLHKNHKAFILKSYPPSQAALSKIDSKGWADRFEFYYNGLELANAFNELTDANKQLKRCEHDLKERKRLGASEVSIDDEFIQALKDGVPPSGGIALGLERLFMTLTGIDSIKDVHQYGC